MTLYQYFSEERNVISKKESNLSHSMREINREIQGIKPPKGYHYNQANNITRDSHAT